MSYLSLEPGRRNYNCHVLPVQVVSRLLRQPSFLKRSRVGCRLHYLDNARLRWRWRRWDITLCTDGTTIEREENHQLVGCLISDHCQWSKEWPNFRLEWWNDCYVLYVNKVGTHYVMPRWHNLICIRQQVSFGGWIKTEMEVQQTMKDYTCNRCGHFDVGTLHASIREAYVGGRRIHIIPAKFLECEQIVEGL
jgi:hypothetical protein